MNLREAINQKWADLTDNGVLDGRVADASKLIDEVRTRLRARYNITNEALRLFEELEREVTDSIKSDVVAQWNAHQARARRTDY